MNTVNDTCEARPFRWSNPECHRLIIELATFDYGANPRAVIALANYRTAQQMTLDLNQRPEMVRAWDELRRKAIAELQAAFTTRHEAAAFPPPADGHPLDG